MDTLLLTDERPRATIARHKIAVPAGFALPEGETVKNPFSLLLESGVRWHPEWPSPQVTVNAFLLMPLGDALSFSGEALIDTFGALLPKEVADLASFHGSAVDALSKQGRDALDALRLSAPSRKQDLSAFILPHQLRQLH